MPCGRPACGVPAAPRSPSYKQPASGPADAPSRATRGAPAATTVAGDRRARTEPPPAPPRLPAPDATSTSASAKWPVANSAGVTAAADNAACLARFLPPTGATIDPRRTFSAAPSSALVSSTLLLLPATAAAATRELCRRSRSAGRGSRGRRGARGPRTRPGAMYTRMNASSPVASLYAPRSIYAPTRLRPTPVTATTDRPLPVPSSASPVAVPVAGCAGRGRSRAKSSGSWHKPREDSAGTSNVPAQALAQGMPSAGARQV